jgi:diguanylate cyclase (GGDEF)-like protein/PAS domain S-box-containing protein
MNAIKTLIKPTTQLSMEITQHLYKQLFVSIPALVILATVVVWGVAGYANIFYLNIWYIVFLGAIALRCALVVWYSYTKNRQELHRLHYILFIINSTLIAILWGISDSLLMPHILSSQFLVIIIIAGVTAGAMASLTPSFLASVLYSSFTLIPLAMWLIYQGDQSIYVGLSIAIVIYWIFLLVVGHRGYILFVTNLKLILEKNNLLENLSFTNTQLAQSIDNLKMINLALHESEERFQQTFNFAAIGMALISPTGHWLRVNKALCDLVGYTEAEMLQMDYQSITYPEDLTNDAEHFQQMIEGKLHTYQVEKRYIHKNGEVIWILLNRVLIRDADDAPLYFISQIQNIDLQKKAEKELRHIAYHDTLTQLDNRKMLEIKFHQVLGYAQRNHHSLAVLFLDLDYFKQVNDSMGHDVGDLLLKAIALRLQYLRRKTDIVVRLSGDEFVLVLTEVIDENEIRNIIDNLQKTISEDIPIKDDVINITSSIGVSFYPRDGDSLHDLLKKADIALYRVKKSGRSGFQFYSDPTSDGSIK